jgi:hypothetical protein
MTKSLAKTMPSAEVRHEDAPSLIPRHHGEMLQEAEALLFRMQGVAPDAVARIAEHMATSAQNVGELGIAEAAAAVHCEAVYGAPIILNCPIQRLSAAIAAAQAGLR